MRPALIVSLLAAALSLAACQPTSFTAPKADAQADGASPKAAAKPAAGQVPANDNLNAVLWVQRDGAAPEAEAAQKAERRRASFADIQAMLAD